MITTNAAYTFTTVPTMSCTVDSTADGVMSSEFEGTVMVGAKVGEKMLIRFKVGALLIADI